MQFRAPAPFGIGSVTRGEPGNSAGLAVMRQKALAPGSTSVKPGVAVLVGGALASGSCVRHNGNQLWIGKRHVGVTVSGPLTLGDSIRH